jgi:methylenetetrahydrofolate reductase (NADPH)
VTTAETPSQKTIGERLREGGRPLFSFEFFPPRDDAGAEQLWRAIKLLQPLSPDFVSVTYGANGSSRDRTVAVTRRLAAKTSLTTMGHLTCASQPVSEIEGVLEAYEDAGVRHILAVRGDMPGGPTAPWLPHPAGLPNATALVSLVKATGPFCVGVAAFPDIHPSRHDSDLDARILLDKQAAGAEFAITQLFFRPESYFSLIERIRAIGCTLPVIPGIMPITQIGQIERFADLSGAPIPDEVEKRLRAVADDPPGVREVGAEIATELSQALLDGGAPGLHFFTQNRSVATMAIWAGLRVRPVAH